MKTWHFIFFFLLCRFAHIDASTTVEIFAKYLNKYFIETGTFKGDGVEMAKMAGFEQIYSIEIAPHYYEYSLRRFSQDHNVKILKGDSSYVLPILLNKIDDNVTFWLDGHYSWGVHSGRGNKDSPIMEELEAIKQHHIKTHTILIDDIRLLGTVHFDYVTLEQIIQKVLEINPDYTIHYENGHVENDILVASIPH